MKVEIQRDHPAAQRQSNRPLAGLRPVVLVAIVLTTLAGCQHLGRIGCGCGFGSTLFGGHCVTPNDSANMPPVKKFSSFVSQRFSQQPPRRVALIPTRLGAGSYDASAKVIEALAAEIRLAGVFEVIQPEQLQCKTTVDEILTGRFDEREIARIGRTYHCDAVMLIRLNQFQGHWPLQASITAAIVDANESIVIFSVDGNWDTADPQIQQGYQSYVDSKSADVPEEARQIYLQSPSNLFAYVARQITDVMKVRR